MSSFEFFVRLDYIQFSESFTVPKFKFRGWCVIPDSSYVDKVEIKPLIFSDSEKRSEFHKGTVASNVQLAKTKINFSPTNRNINLHDCNLNGLQLIFEGEFELAIEPGKYSVILDANFASFRALSNKWDFILRPESHRYQSQAEFITPRVSWVKSSFFILSGWAYREADSIKHVQFLIDNILIEDVVLGLNSKHFSETVLNVKDGAGAVFARVVFIEEITRISKWLDIKAHILFNSGEKIELVFPAFRVEPPENNNYYLESANVGLDHIARVSGFSMFGDAAIRTKKNFSLLNTKIIGHDENFPESNLGRKFEAGLKLEKTPGYAQIFLRDIKGWSLAKPQHLQNYLRRSIDYNCFRFSKIKGLVQKLNSLLPGADVPKLKGCLNNSKKLFVVSHNLSNVEGAPKVLLEIVSAFKASKMFDEIIVVSPIDGELANLWRALGAKVEIISDIIEAKKLLFNYRPSLVLANTISSYWSVSAAIELEIKTLWSIHESVSPYQAMINLPIEQWNSFVQACKKANKICFVSSATKELYLRNFPFIKSEVISNGIDLILPDIKREQARAELGLNDSDFMILCVGTTAYRKGQDIILNELSLLRSRINKEIKCFFVGARESDFLDSLRVLARDLNLNVNFISETVDTAKYYMAADVKIIASREESAPLVSLEAMKFGLPIISTNVFGLAEQLEDQKTCLFFNFDLKGDLAEKIIKIYTDTDLRNYLISSSKQVVAEKFNKHSQLEKYKSLVSLILTQN